LIQESPTDPAVKFILILAGVSAKTVFSGPLLCRNFILLKPAGMQQLPSSFSGAAATPRAESRVS
jgi:hypothetical protein